ncbi:class I adenylate-forming enzyme family protein [Gordonia sp. OPL2]|uniref:class I adenylate-forming enzyme family protein n=1 Tax=Gordonia sp. OPL2 TaxID=2486274 RepID=UPI0016566574|nr:AMP-binding protein [Gordonia sp. OPL2]ROZ99056.1 acyl-CoA synthetase [Gordonia sp. OPL2]
MKTLASELVARAASTPEHVAVIDQLGTHTVATVVDAAQAIAAALARHSESAPTVVIQADNTWHTLASAVAVGLRGGLVAVLSPHATAAEFDLAVEDIAPDVVIATDDVLDHWGAADGRFTHRLDADTSRTILATTDVGDIRRWADGSAIAMTSGSTGRPKCVVQSENAIRYAAQCTIDAVGLRPGDAIGAFVPLSSVAAFCFGMYLPAYLGGAMICIDRWTPSAALAALREQSVAWTMLVPTMALQLSIADGAESPLTSLRAMTVGGGPMNVRALRQAEETLGTTFLRVFGMSECLGHTTPSPTDPPDLRLGRDGKPFPGTVVRAVDAGGASLPSGQIGDAQVRGPSLFVGYARNGRPVPPELTADGFLPTGDLVEIGTDGYITVMGRQKQIIIRGGRNIDINEVESAIANIPGVVQVCVVPVPDDMLGERAAALVVAGDAEMTLASVTAQLDRSGFPKFKWPEYVFAVEDLPQNRVGKLSRPDAIALAGRLAAQSV